ncbi:hypothetical protein RchiOBHm_Chr4g0426301 [Rosa chinensis]|uniref:Uncharacterized protein n=1 Tax=Rosa chinensis TaxID=74649 RepID=A0A2P6QZF9_ROSCH|nr:hypothetical protein RchiOBHm_Chr4g0426301 [Rosa chinensis]
MLIYSQQPSIRSNATISYTWNTKSQHSGSYRGLKKPNSKLLPLDTKRVPIFTSCSFHVVVSLEVHSWKRRMRGKAFSDTFWEFAEHCGLHQCEPEGRNI